MRSCPWLLLIQQARERQRQEIQRAAEQEEQVEVREFQLPNLNFKASTFDQLIDWERERSLSHRYSGTWTTTGSAASRRRR